MENEISAHKISKIHFGNSVSFDENVISCESKDESCSVVQLGLLSVHHTYQIVFHLKHSLGKEVQVPCIQTPVAEITKLKYLGNGHEVTVHIKCSSEGKLHEEISIANSENISLTIRLIANVMGATKGTPALKSGVKILHKAEDVLSDANSDWQGFE